MRKNILTGEFKIKEIGANSTAIFFLVQLDQDPTRTVLVKLPARSIPTFDRKVGAAVQDLRAHSNGGTGFVDVSQHELT